MNARFSKKTMLKELVDRMLIARAEYARCTGGVEYDYRKGLVQVPEGNTAAAMEYGKIVAFERLITAIESGEV